MIVYTLKILGYFNPNAGLSLLGHFLGVFFSVWVFFVLSSPWVRRNNPIWVCFLVLLRSWVRRNPAVGLFIAGILRRLLERAVLSQIELMHLFGKYRFVYILFY